MKTLTLRKNMSALTDTQRQALVDAFLSLKSAGKYDKYADQHNTYFGDAHGNPFFFPWHRKFLRDLEKELQDIDPSVALPYWDSTQNQSTTGLPWTSDFMGGDGNPVSGPFEPWGIRRALGASGSLPDASDITGILGLDPYGDFWSPAEGLHGPPHNWVGGNMATRRSPEDPIFFLHHCFVDKWWSDWQLAHPTLDAYEGSGIRSPGAPMPPWATTPNDTLDSVEMGYMYDTDPVRVELKTTALHFIDIPEGEETVRGITFNVVANTLLSFNITSGPGSDFNTPYGTSVTVDPAGGAVCGETILWISYRGTSDGDIASGSVTVNCPQTGESWTLSIEANTIARPTVGVALVLDKSGSMDTDIGDGRSRNELLRFAADIFANVIQDNNGIGIAAFDHDAVPVMDIKEAGAPLGGAVIGQGRLEAIGHIAGHTPNPDGYTSIGDGVDVANTLMNAASTEYEEMAMLVFTDGKENRSQYISDVSDLINDRVFAIGMGTASDLNATALAELCNNSGGELYLTDTIDPNDDYFKLAKYYLQVLSGITNTDIVTDPEDWIKPGEQHAIPFQLNETDISHDVVLLCPAPYAVKMTLETPQGDIIDPGFANSAVGVTYVPGATFSYYRVTLPVVGASGTAAREGTWTALLEVDRKYYKRYINSLDNYPHLMEQAKLHGIRYNLSIYALSNLRLTATLSQDSYEPGALLTLRASLVEYGLPLAGEATIAAEVTMPDDTKATLPLAEVGQGVFEVETPAALSGVYTFYLKAEGTTARDRPFTREKLLTAAVWQGGNNPPPTTPEGDKDSERFCEFFACLLSEKVLTDPFKKKLLDSGIDLDNLRRCIAQWCRKGNPPNDRSLVSELATVVHQLAAQPALAKSVRTILDTLSTKDKT